jgi:probable addiction module antidote protein
MPRLATTPWDVVEHLKTEEDMALYLEAALDDGDPVLISAVIGDIARARGVTDVAVETGADQETASEMVATHGDSDLATMLRVIKAAGLRLRVSAGR